MLKITEVTPEICHFKFKDDEDLILHFIRFAEFYECENEKLFRKKFTLDEALDYYRQTKKINYFNNFTAFNVPVSMISRMAGEYKDALTPMEALIIATINDLRAKTGNNVKYVIGTSGDDDDVDEIQHELCHGFYYTDKVYKLQMDSITRNLPKRVTQELHKFLKKEGYHQTVWDDEIQAYMATGFENDDIINLKLIKLFRSDYVDIFLEATSRHELL